MTGDSRTSGGDGLKVSVVVPVYNPGRYIKPLITSLLAQTLTPDEFEAIFVDDGSTDETPALLDDLAAQHPHLRVIHQPNSGWPGKPRNVGMDAAQGEFIQFVDHDDRLAKDALSRLYDRAMETSADVVIGKVVSVGRRTPMEVFWERRDHADLATYPLESSLTPHKLFRTSMLRDKNIRYLEGKRRLEDNPFVLESYFAARHVAVLADAPCYYFTKRSDNGNHSFDFSAPADYYRSLRDSLDVVETHTEPGALRDRLLRHFYLAKMLGRLKEPKILRTAPDLRQDVLDEVRLLMDERFPESVFSGLSYGDRLRTDLVRAGRLQQLVTMAQRCTDVQLNTKLQAVSWDSNDTLRIEFSASLGFEDGSPLLFTPERDGYCLDPRLTAGLFDANVVEIVSGEEIREQTSLRLLLHNVRTKVTWDVPCVTRAQLVPAVDSRGHESRYLRFVCTGSLDPRTIRGGKALTPDAWSLRVNATVCGLRRGGPLKAGDVRDIPSTRIRVRGARTVHAFLSKSGVLRLRVERDDDQASQSSRGPRAAEVATDRVDVVGADPTPSGLGRAADRLLAPLPAGRIDRYRARLKRMVDKLNR